jgi:hypothetical protein
MQSESGGAISKRAFDWLSWKPGLYYHPMCWVKSVNGASKTPKSKSTNKLPPQPEIIKFLSGMYEKNVGQTLEWHMEKIGHVVLEDLDFVSMFDLVAEYDFTFYSRDTSFRKYEHPPYLYGSRTDENEKTCEGWRAHCAVYPTSAGPLSPENQQGFT